MEAYENDLYWVYFEDVLFVPMLFFYAQKIVFINDLYYLHRHMKSNLSSTLVPKEYHYETVVAKKIVLQLDVYKRQEQRSSLPDRRQDG